ncbi:hypothetical protein [Treponema bryantii]|uniref:hypothetical protein n=1 Tax=Treponema bryantii TaxID=163 RepID=UPI002B2B15B7|nr:hypothetical protein TRBR_14970 [Treponema bryantii]
MESIDVLLKHIELFRKATKEKSRYWSWIDCNKAFIANAKITEEDQAKILFMYLASWGMLRNSFLLEYNYRILIPIVKLLNTPKYSILKNPEIDIIENNIDLLWELTIEIRKAFKEYHPDGPVSDTLTTKILMGTIGCTVAYDRYVIQTLREYKIASGNYGKRSILELCKYYKAHPELETIRQVIKKEDKIDYPPMKILDMGCWEDK